MTDAIDVAQALEEYIDEYHKNHGPPRNIIDSGIEDFALALAESIRNKVDKKI